MVLTLTEAQLAEMIAHVEAARPNEGCGLLGGRAGQVLRVYLITNIEHSPVRYTMDPTEQVQAMVAIEAAGWEVVGIFHSHPAGPPAPSATDLARAHYPDSAYVILAPDAAGAWQARAFQLRDGRATEVRLQLVAASGR